MSTLAEATSVIQSRIVFACCLHLIWTFDVNTIFLALIRLQTTPIKLSLITFDTCKTCEGCWVVDSHVNCWRILIIYILITCVFAEKHMFRVNVFKQRMNTSNYPIQSSIKRMACKRADKNKQNNKSSHFRVNFKSKL